jgi:heme exporter protein C
MREKVLYSLSAVIAALLAFDLYQICLVLPDEANQGLIWRILYFHFPSIFASFLGFFVALVCSILYLIRKDLRFDAIAAAVTEVSWAFSTIVLVTGSIWGRRTWGIWWTWDARLTSMLVCWLLYAGYVMLRRSVDETTQRARLAAALNIFAFADVIIVWKSIEWWRTQHPAPVLSVRKGGGMAPGMEMPLWLNMLAFALLGAVLVAVRMRQETMRTEIEALRREAHAM